MILLLAEFFQSYELKKRRLRHGLPALSAWRHGLHMPCSGVVSEQELLQGEGRRPIDTPGRDGERCHHKEGNVLSKANAGIRGTNSR